MQHQGFAVKLQRSSRYAEQVKQMCVMLVVDWSMTADEASDLLHGTPCPRTIQGWVADYYAKGVVVASVGHKGVLHHDRKLDPIAVQHFFEIVSDDPSLYLYEIADMMTEQTGQDWETYDVSRAMKQLGYKRVRSICLAAEADPQKQKQFVDFIKTLDAGPLHFVFIDETAADSRCTNREYVWALPGAKVCTESVFVRGQRFTTIAAMSADGLVGDPLIMLGAASAQDFNDWFLSSVWPLLGKFPECRHSVVVMDNCRIHDKALLEEICASVGALLVFLPPYSPNYNPIELLFGYVKTWLKSHRSEYENWTPVDTLQYLLKYELPKSHCEKWIRLVDCYDTNVTPQY